MKKKWRLPFTRREIRAAAYFGAVAWIIAAGFKPPAWTMLVAAFIWLFAMSFTAKTDERKAS